jgi:hypothetical protein
LLPLLELDPPQPAITSAAASAAHAMRRIEGSLSVSLARIRVKYAHALGRFRLNVR